jgi:hypothetical protein
VAQLMSGLVEELGRQNAEIIPRLEMIVEEIHSQRGEVVEELKAQRGAMLSLLGILERMEARQLEIVRSVQYFREEAEKEGERQEQTIDILQRSLELQENQRKGFWSRLFNP